MKTCHQRYKEEYNRQFLQPMLALVGVFVFWLSLYQQSSDIPLYFYALLIPAHQKQRRQNSDQETDARGSETALQMNLQTSFPMMLVSLPPLSSQVPVYTLAELSAPQVLYRNLADFILPHSYKELNVIVSLVPSGRKRRMLQKNFHITGNWDRRLLKHHVYTRTFVCMYVHYLIS